MVAVVLEGIAFGESPRWHDGRLWFADWLAHEIGAVTPAGQREVVFRADFPTMPMCFDFLDGQPLIVSSSDGLLLRLTPSGLVTHADLGGVGFNEIVVARDGGCYVNGGGFDLMAGEEFRPGAILHVSRDGEVRQVADDIAFGNGMALTPDGSTLIVAESYANRLTVFSVLPGGGLADRTVWADLGTGVPDGIALDAAGAVWVSDVPGRSCSRVRRGGEVLETLSLGRGCFACALSEDTLYLVTQEWRGLDGVGTAAERTGRILAHPVPAGRA
ncbi:SMP-30/gluconolactonase/LRE family protein [Amycolatopsis mongoliensis]|uniref:SMP-30/gluconolactonase/LRE family protein n=1 Tax=Amycolatopsis mongoliensis TaxID=715475 RepID=A0A9Y2JT55_9PSEU|nr:SMP-30/gluconolactonase/LRE family protein [Amycolatopsis sp. 4-36]WIY02877.1 SMP-30/gluconolactonase/LRE family protein [Amycolatopsis sp. 4-36]